MTDIVERLRVHSDTEEVMRAWDALRAYLLDGKKGSYARDIFEAILSHIDDGRDEAADEIERLRNERDLHIGMLVAKTDQYITERKRAEAAERRVFELEFELKAKCAELDKLRSLYEQQGLSAFTVAKEGSEG